VETSVKPEKGVRRGRNCTSSLPVFRTSSQRGPCVYSKKVYGESHVTQEGDMAPYGSINTEVGVETFPKYSFNGGTSRGTPY